MFPSEIYQQALSKEFDLAYHGKLGSIESWQSMPVGERDWHFRKLVEIKEEEHRLHQEEKAKLQQEAATAKGKARRK